MLSSKSMHGTMIACPRVLHLTSTVYDMIVSEQLQIMGLTELARRSPWSSSRSTATRRRPSLTIQLVLQHPLKVMKFAMSTNSVWQRYVLFEMAGLKLDADLSTQAFRSTVTLQLWYQGVLLFEKKLITDKLQIPNKHSQSINECNSTVLVL